MRTTIEPALPTLAQLETARLLFEAYEPRDLFYRAATELVTLAFDGKTTLSIAESIAVLLQTWNSQYYRFHPFDAEHFAALEALLSLHRSKIIALRSRSIISIIAAEVKEIAELFTAFESLLGPVGAAKALHLLGPQFFPLWDREIAKAYGIALDASGLNAAGYLRFMTIVVSQVVQLSSSEQLDRLLKRIDEFNYCRFTKRWI